MLLTGSTQVEAYLTLFVLLAPLPIYWLVSWFSWRSASSEERQAAYVIRQELAERFNETPPKAGRWWPGYVYDTERAKRREAYEAPPV